MEKCMVLYFMFSHRATNQCQFVVNPYEEPKEELAISHYSQKAALGATAKFR